MTFREHYIALKHQERPPHPAKAFILRIAEITGKNPKTISQWLSGIQFPTRGDRQKISDVLGISTSELFPDMV